MFKWESQKSCLRRLMMDTICCHCTSQAKIIFKIKMIQELIENIIITRYFWSRRKTTKCLGPWLLHILFTMQEPRFREHLKVLCSNLDHMALMYILITRIALSCFATIKIWRLDLEVMVLQLGWMSSCSMVGLVHVRHLHLQFWCTTAKNMKMMNFRLRI